MMAGVPVREVAGWVLGVGVAGGAVWVVCGALFRQRPRHVPPEALRDYDVTYEGCEEMRRRFEWVEDDWVDVPRNRR